MSPTEIQINHHKITLFSDRNAKNLQWRKFGCTYVIDATGCYLTMDKCKEHDVDHVIITAPAKDDLPTFIYGANHTQYNGEKIISNSSCTTNCLAPMLKALNDAYTIDNCNFTTIHATTASQYTVDILNKSARTNRSIFNNIIPHTTGASSSITCVLPELKGKIQGTSLRVPVLNCSLIDLNVELENKDVKLKDIAALLQSHSLFDIVYQTNTKNLVSCDFITTKTPTILDIKASIDLGNGRFKLFLWYDNEWSYSAQIIRNIEHMHAYTMHNLNPLRYFENIDMTDKRVVIRCDFNVPKQNNIVTDDLRIYSAIYTIQQILNTKNPKCVILTSHFGRPKSKNSAESLEFAIPILEKYLGKSVKFLEDGISSTTLSLLEQETHKIYLLENLRFHKEETAYETMNHADIEQNHIIQLYRQLGDIYISDAFGCVHRKHMSICDMKISGKQYGYGKLILHEVNALDCLISNKSSCILGIIGGNKIKDKMPLINSLCKINHSTLFIAGGIAKKYKQENPDSDMIVMKDGYGNISLNEDPIYIENIHDQDYCAFDVGPQSLTDLFGLIDKSDIIFWNGSLGVIEDERYSINSKELVKYLKKATSKRVIIGGGETASLFNDDNDDPDHIYVSTGGGALLEYIQHKILYGVNIVGLDFD